MSKIRPRHYLLESWKLLASDLASDPCLMFSGSQVKDGEKK